MNERQPEVERVPDAGEPRIWVASLADYTNGHLHGEWIRANQTPEELLADIQRILADSHEPGAEEWAIFDYDRFYGLRIGEYESLETVSTLAKAIVEHGEPFAAWADDIGVDEAAEHVDLFLDAYIGRYDSPEAFAEEMWDDLGFDAELEKAVPESLRSYVAVDYTGWAQDLRLSGEITYLDASDGGVYVFRNL